jgi:hypothetical protein
MEIWKDIPGTNGLYEVSNLCRVKSIDRITHVKYNNGTIRSKKYKGRIIKTPLINTGYQHFYCWIDGKSTCFLLHRAVALAFIPNPENKPDINHIDGIKSNCVLSNLEWCTHSENMQHAVRTGLRLPNNLDKIGCLSPNAKVVLQFTKSGEFIKKWPCVVEAAEALGLYKSGISCCALGKAKSCGNFIWKYEIG